MNKNVRSPAAGKQESENTAESWEAARNYAALLGEIPNSFSTLVRSQVGSVEKNDQALADLSRYQMLRLLKGDSMKAVVYFAVLTFRQDLLRDTKGLGPRELIRLFDPFELAATVAVTYLFRRLRKICKSEEFRYIAEAVHLHTDLGAFIGQAIPNISPGRGMIVGAMPHLAQGIFLKHDERGYKEYRRALKNNKRSMPEYESRRWGCTATQVASILLQSIGFGVNVAEAYTRGTSSETGEELDDAAYVFKITEVWIEALLRTGRAPDMTHRGTFYPLQKDLDILLAHAQQLRSSGSRHKWLEKGKDDIGPALTPLLFEAREPAAPVASEASDLDELVELDEGGKG